MSSRTEIAPSGDYRIELKVKNQRLWSAMTQSGCRTVADLARLSGVNQRAIGEMMSLKLSAYTRLGCVRVSVEKLCDTLGCIPEDIFPPEVLYEGLENNTFVSEVTSAQMAKMVIKSPEDQLVLDGASDAVAKAISTLTTREQKVLRMRYGLDGDEMTLDQIADAFSVDSHPHTRERIRQIESKALRKMRGSDGIGSLKEIYEVAGL